MRLSEVVIIYLAAAAPFGVTFFLRRGTRGARRREAAARAAGAALVWPAWLIVRLVGDARAAEGAARFGRRGALEEKAVERAKRVTVNALRRVEDALGRDGLLACESERYAFFAARECAERYAGLTLACEGAHPGDAPSAREMELCRIAGRAGDDLLVAGRCFHRRNVTRLLAHRDRARADFEDSLSEARAAMLNTLAKKPACGAGTEASAAMSEALAGAVTLFSFTGDEAASARTARLLGAGLSELRVGGGVQVSDDTAEGSRLCMTQAAHTAFADPPRSATTFTRG